MANIIVTHPWADMDAFMSALALEGLFSKYYHGVIKIVFLTETETYHNLVVSNDAEYVELGGNRVYHVDCGAGKFNDDGDGDKRLCTLQIIDQHFGLVTRFPAWRAVVSYVARVDMGQRDEVFDKANDIDLWRHSGDTDYDILGRLRIWLKDVLDLEQMKIEIKRLSVQTISDPSQIDTHGTHYIGKIKAGKHSLGIVVSYSTLMNRLLQVRLRNVTGINVTFDVNSGNTVIWASDADLDLVDSGIVGAIRCAEAAKRGLTLCDEEVSLLGDTLRDGNRLMSWFAFAPNGHVRGLFDGSPKKAGIPAELRTRLSKEEIINAVVAALRSS